MAIDTNGVLCTSRVHLVLAAKFLVSLFFFFGCARNGLSAMTVSFAGIDRHVRKISRESVQSDVDKSNPWPSGSIQLAALFSFCQTT